MEKILNKKTGLILLIIAITESLSYAGYLWPDLNKIGFVVICLATIWLAVKNLRYALLLVLAELIISSKGYLFFYEINGTAVSIRIALWLIVMGFWLASLINTAIKNKLWPNLLPNFAYAKYFYVLMLAVAWGLVMAMFRGNDFSNIFFDINNWFYLTLIFPLAQSFGYPGKPHPDPLLSKEREIYWQKLFQVGTVAVAWLVVETAGLLFFFSHTGDWGDSAIYRWLRVSGVGEVTSMGSGFVRVFFQSHIYLVLGVCLLLPIIIERIKNKPLPNLPLGKGEEPRGGLWLSWWLATAGLTIVLIGQSRSFWVGLIAALAVLIIYLLKDKLAWQAWLKFVGLAVMSVVASLLIMTALVKLPGLGAWNALSQRSNLDESAVASRWNLIPKLWQAIKISPIVGQGFGKTVTYQSSDPRVLEQSADGTYETYAFEWGWLDIWLKMGLLGVLTYLLLLIKLTRDSLANQQIGLVLCLIALATVHFFTPYLNHPLGLGIIMLSAVWLSNVKARS